MSTAPPPGSSGPPRSLRTDGAEQARLIGVIGAGQCDADVAERARTVGRLLGEAGCAVATGGLGGVMAAASRGAREAGATVVAILPGDDPSAATPDADVVIATGVGDARNAILANTCAAFVAVGGSYGTLSEIAFALKRSKRVVTLDSWELGLPVLRARSPAEAVRLVSSDEPT